MTGRKSGWLMPWPLLVLLHGHLGGARAGSRALSAWPWLALTLVLGAGPAEAAIFTVNNVGDAGDKKLDNICDTTNNSNVCTLRAAIEEANFTGGADTINFTIAPAGAKTITLLSALPTITTVVTIDGTTQTGSVGGIELNGASAGGNHALTLSGAGSSGSTIKGLVIDQFAGAGISIRIISSSNNVITGNYLGIDPTGTLTGRGNAVGVYVQFGTNNRIGGTTAAERNVISGNRVDGIQLDNTDNNLVQGNYIGLNAAGTAKVGNAAKGISIYSGSDDNTIGGNTISAPGAGNVISGNNQGVVISTMGNIVRGNLIGTRSDGTGAIGNTVNGVSLDPNSSANIIGGSTAGDGNTIANNGGNAVWLGGPSPVNITVLGNRIFANGGIGIDLNSDAGDQNDTGDGDGGANRKQNHPVLSAVVTDGAGTAHFAGSLNSAANTTYRLEFFANSVGDGNGYGEGESYLGATDVTTNGSGNAIIGVSMATVTPLTPGKFVSSTATVCTNPPLCTTFGDTSEFGGNFVAVGTLLVTTTEDNTTGSNMTSVSTLIGNPGADGRISLREAITAANNTVGANTIGFGIPLIDAGHFYYKNNGGAGLAEAQTTLADWHTPSSPAIGDWDPDYPGCPCPPALARSWYRIQPLSALPNISSPLVLAFLDGHRANPLSNNVGPQIELDGTSAGAGVYGLRLAPGSSGSILRGLVVNRFNAAAIHVTGSSSNVIEASYLGTNVAGTADLGNGDGINVDNGASDNTLGGTAAGAGNVISGNDVNGIAIIGLGTSNNRVLGSIIGLDVTGNADLGNTLVGVAIADGATANIIGDAGAGRNVISGNNQFGVRIVDNGTSSNRVQNNLIGLDSTGTIERGNGADGVRLQSATATGNVIGGTTAGLGNVISGNNGAGIYVRDGIAATLIAGNTIGRNAANDAAIPNTGAGVLVASIVASTTSATIGGTGTDDRNIIASNGGDGIALTENGGFVPTGITILRNKIFSNGGLGIDLSDNGVTDNDLLDGDSGPNDLLNQPVIRSVRTTGVGNLNVVFGLDVPAGTYRIEFFKNASGTDLSGYGEGELFLDSRNVTHLGGGTAFFNHVVAGVFGDVITATATRCTDGTCGAFTSTSEFGNGMAAITTVVKLVSFTAVARDRAVDLEWETASELDNLGFHLYRGLAASGPWTKLNASLIPGLGSSPEGKRYSFLDAGLTNGTTYSYRLEDVDRLGRLTSNGPISATPEAGEPGEGDGPTEPPPSPGETPAPERKTHGDPAQQSLRVVERTAFGVTLELVTGGFYSQEQPDRTTKLVIPGFFDRAEPGLPTVPTRRLWIDAVVGRGVDLVSVEPSDIVSFSGLSVSLAGRPVAVAASDGTYRAGSIPARPKARGTKAKPPGSFPESLAFVHQTAFQGERKKAYVELAPLQVDEASGDVTLARRLVVRLAFAGRVEGERGRGSLGRSAPVVSAASDTQVLARLATRSRGVYSVAFEEIPGLSAPVFPSDLRLSRLGVPVAFHLEPRRLPFGPGSVLYFLAEGSDSAYANEAVYELALGPGGIRMPGVLPTRRLPPSNALALLRHERSFETDAVYLPALLEARDLWVWDYGLGGGQGASYSFTLPSPVLAPETARLTVDLQGGSDTETDPDHHVLAFVNGSLVGEIRFDGMVPATLAVELPSSLLLEGENSLLLENAGDTGSTASFVYLDRFSIEVPEGIVPLAGVVEGRASRPGRASLEAAPGSLVLDVTGATPRFLARATADGRLAWNAETDHRYLAVLPEGFLRPEVRGVPPGTLRSPANQADWILVSPEALLPAAQPLVALRQSQGLSALAVSLEAVVDEFGYGESGPHALQGFLAYAFHDWLAPSPRYVLLLGDASYDPKGRLAATSRPDLIPSPLTKSTFLWTPADPLYAAVNGQDSLPDLAIGRINAATLEEAQTAIQKILDFETSGQTMAGKATLVADNPDLAGDFEANQDEIATLLPSRSVEKLYLTQLGTTGTNAAVRSAFDAGLSLMSYVGHGSSGLWASEGILRSAEIASFAAQPAQPLVLTMTCSNGYFLSPFNNSLSERLVLADHRGAIAAFSPSGLSLDDAAHVYHRAVVTELEQANHQRLGDLLLAAQASYAATGAFPELLQIYNLLGDPGLRIR